MTRTMRAALVSLLPVMLTSSMALAQMAKPAEQHTPRLASVSGRVTLLESQSRRVDDVAQSIIWLASSRDVALVPDRVAIIMSDREFTPHVMVVPVGTTVSFPNRDPFTHNVFSRSAARPFDLGHYGRGDAGSIVLRRPGVVLVLCNIHAQMSAVVVVRDNPYYIQPAADGSFRIMGVPPGDYTLHAWHERAKEFAPQSVRIGAGGIDNLAIQLDARSHRFEQQLNEHGQPYSRVRKGRRY